MLLIRGVQLHWNYIKVILYIKRQLCRFEQQNSKSMAFTQSRWIAQIHDLSVCNKGPVLSVHEVQAPAIIGSFMVPFLVLYLPVVIYYTC